MKSMLAKLRLFFVAACLFPYLLQSAPYRSAYGHDSNHSMKELQDALSTLKHQWRNHDTQIKILQEQIENQNETIEDLREDFFGIQETEEDRQQNLAAQIKGLQGEVDHLRNSIADIQKNFNSTADTFNQGQKKQNSIEKRLSEQSGRIDKLQAGIYAIMDELDIPHASSIGKNYTVQPGDSLGAIAIKHKTSVKNLKKLNGLKNDTIFPGQKLKVP